MKLAIYTEAPGVYSETFVRMQIDGLSHALLIHGGPVANETVPGGRIQPLQSLQGLFDTAYWCGLKKTKWEGPHAAELKRRLKRHRITTVLANFGPPAVALMPVCRALSIPLIAHFHGYDAHTSDVIARYGRSYQELGRQAAAIIVVSGTMKAAIIEAGIPEEKIHLLRYGVDPARFPEKKTFPASPIFFGVGRFVDKKAPYLTLFAFADAHRRCPSIKLVLAGDGPLLETSVNVACALGIKDAVEFAGVLSPAEVARRMQQATAFVQHSITPRFGPARGDMEGTPVAVLEALMTGLPVIATRHAGIGEVVQDGQTGFLVGERDVLGMAASMVSLAESPGLATKMGHAARESALKNYTAENYLSSLQRIIRLVAVSSP